MIEARNVTKRYGAHTVVDSVSLTIPRGGITSFIGPNGAGKSTLLSIMSRLLPSDGGEVFVDGQAVSRARSEDLARRLAILKQDNHIGVRLTVRDLVGFGRFPYSKGRLSASERRHIDDVLDYLDLDDLQHRFLDQLSGGQRQRAFLGMVLCQDTDYILLDEPLNNLDLKHSAQIMQLLRRLADERDKTIIVVLHDINFASCHADTIVALKDGKVVRAGSPAEVIEVGALREIYDMDIRVEVIGGRQIAVYFG
ncbi:MAG: ATP-binding cassette domain-containing protein [Chloroflexi bacterium]|nr:ATP-binding cassette domain-containing protein [Chloroflexota bacterium]